MSIVKYKHGNLILDDWTQQTEYGDNDYFGWTQICESCRQKLTDEHGLAEGEGHGICGVKGCNTESDHYLDFDKDEIDSP